MEATVKAQVGIGLDTHTFGHMRALDSGRGCAEDKATLRARAGLRVSVTIRTRARFRVLTRGLG